MDKTLLLIGKILLGILVFFIFSFFVYWFQMYRDSNKKGLDRITNSFGEALLYYVWGLLATFAGDVGPFNFFLSIYGIKNVDFPS